MAEPIFIDGHSNLFDQKKRYISLNIPNTIHDLAEKFGPSNEGSIIPELNRHDSSIKNNIAQLRYPGLEVVLLVPEKSDHKGGITKLKGVLREVAIVSNKYSLIKGLTVGASREKVIEVLGKPDISTGNPLIYSDVFTEDADNELKVFLKDNKVVRFLYLPYQG